MENEKIHGEDLMQDVVSMKLRLQKLCPAAVSKIRDRVKGERYGTAEVDATI